MAVNSVGSYGSYNSGDNNVTPSNTLDKDAFLQLLLTQLRYQNPLEPMEDKDFISQMASFSSLEQMQNLNTTIADLVASNQLQQGAALIGKKVSYITITGEETATVTGKVQGVTRDSSGIYLNVDGVMIAMDQVWKVEPDDTGETGDNDDTGETGETGDNDTGDAQ